VKDPLLRKGELRGGKLSCSLEALGELQQNILAGLPNLVTESTVTVHDLDVEADITTWSIGVSFAVSG